MVSPAQAYRAAWTDEARQRLSNELQAYGNCLRGNVTVSGDSVTISRSGYKNCGSNIRTLMRQYMRQG